MASRIIAQIVVAGVQIAGKAFVAAYRQAAANAARNPPKGSGASASASASASEGAGSAANSAAAGTQAAANVPPPSITAELTRKTGMSLDEAGLILNAKEVEDVAANFEHLFKVNEKKAGGSFYLQSKVVRAKERIEAELHATGKLKGSISDMERAAASAGATNATSEATSEATAKSPPSKGE